MNKIEALIKLISFKGTQQFLLDHAQDDADYLTLKYSKDKGFKIGDISTQIELRQKAKNKIGGFIKSETVLLPKLYEQSTQQDVAQFKARFIHGNTLLDATAGLGIDTFFIGMNFKKIICLEANPDHALLLKHNFSLHSKHPEIINTTLEDFIEKTNVKFDVIYIDPDRRPDAGRKYFGIEQSTPDVIALKSELLKRAGEVWIKLSPMMDIQAIAQHFTPNISEVYCIAYQNEMKEILVCLKPGLQQMNSTAVNITNGSVSIFASENQDKKPSVSVPGKYFFEPNVALIKSKLCMEYAVKNNFQVLYPHGYFFTSDTLTENLHGRLFEIIETFPFKKDILKSFIQKHSIKKVNISCRNFFWKPEEVKAQLKLADGGEWYLFCYNDVDKKPVAVWCRKLSES